MQNQSPPLPTALLITLFAGLFLLLCAYAFRGWLDHGADIFLAMAQSGMAWCL